MIFWKLQSRWINETNLEGRRKLERKCLDKEVTRKRLITSVGSQKEKGQHQMSLKRPTCPPLKRSKSDGGVLGVMVRSAENTSLPRFPHPAPAAGTDPAQDMGVLFWGQWSAQEKNDTRSAFNQKLPSASHLCAPEEMFQSAFQCLVIYTWFYTHCLSL